MRLNHLDLQVSDVQAARVFFETHFDLQCVYARGSQLAFFGDDTGFSFGVSNLNGQSGRPSYPPDFHIGFILEEASQVEAVYQRLRSAGVETLSAPREGGPNVYFMCRGPDDLLIEVRAPKWP
ncbi:VOC family protein [Deinococcus apachensis]|uniref:VOC family protein n=1 Tax=Deinococcus apachensis TaxID=309886 RepID=UPI000381CD62|nr:VOC family protein [Deinococcus apachensis]